MCKGPGAQGSMENSKEIKLDCLQHIQQRALWGETRLGKDTGARRGRGLQARGTKDFRLYSNGKRLKGFTHGVCYEYIELHIFVD